MNTEPHMRPLLTALVLGLSVLANPAKASEGSAALGTLFAQADNAALVRAGQRFEHGEGVERDFDAAVKCYCRAAEDGDAEAQYRLGWMYANARGVERNDALAAAWFGEAARNGDRHAERMLARLDTPAERPLCIRPDGSVYRKPIESVPNPSRALIAEWVERLAPDYGLDPALVLAVIRTESNFNPRARSPKDAQGLMQLIPATAERFGVQDSFDPLQNLRGGMAYLRWLLDFFEGNEVHALAGYNAGENAVTRYKGVPPYAETRAYVKRVSMLRKRPPRRVLGAS